MNDIKLIANVKNHELIYNFNLEDYDNKIIREKVWEEIAHTMGVPVIQCKRRWSNLKCRYIKSEKEQAKKATCVKSNIKQWRYSKEMVFMKPYINKLLQRCVSLEKRKAISHCKGLRSTPIIGNSTLNAGNSSFKDVPEICSPQITATPIPVLNNDNTPKSSTEPKIIETTSLAWNCPSMKRQSSQDVLMKYFETVAEMVREFPPALQVKVKSEISKIVHQAEMEYVHQMQHMEIKQNTSQSGQQISMSSSNDDKSMHLQLALKKEYSR